MVDIRPAETAQARALVERKLSGRRINVAKFSPGVKSEFQRLINEPETLRQLSATILRPAQKSGVTSTATERTLQMSLPADIRGTSVEEVRSQQSLIPASQTLRSGGRSVIEEQFTPAPEEDLQRGRDVRVEEDKDFIEKTESFVQEKVSVRRGVESFLDFSQFIGEKTGVRRLEEEGFLPDIRVKKSTAIDIGTDISKFLLFAPAMGTSVDIARGAAIEEVFFTGTQQKVGKDLIKTDVGFITSGGRKGFAKGVSKQTSKVVGGEEFLISKSLGFGKEISRGIEFPTGRIVERPTTKFLGVEKGVGKRFDDRFLGVSKGKVIFKRPLKRKELLDFEAISGEVSFKDISISGGGARSIKGDIISGGIVKRLPTKEAGDSFIIKTVGRGGTRGGSQIVDQAAFQQVQNIVKTSIKKSPRATPSTALPSTTSSQVSKQIQKAVSLPSVQTQIPKQKTKVRQKEITKQLSFQMEAPKQKTRQRRSLVSKQEEILTQAPRLDIVQRTVQKQKQGLRTKVKTKTEQRARPRPRFDVALIPPRTPRRPILPPILPPLDLGGGRKKKKGTRGFVRTPSLGAVLKFELTGFGGGRVGKGLEQTGLVERGFEFKLPNIKLPTVI